MKPRITFVSAGAGSGKTHRLTEILHTRLASGEVRAAGVIATTFTKKAAAELRERARTYLMSRDDYALATALDQARIGTVNSVCGELLLRFSFEAALPSDQQVLDEARAKALLAQAIDSVMEDREPQELHALADRLGVESWKEDLGTLVDQVRANDIEPSALAAMGEENAVDLLAHFPRATGENLDAALIAALDPVLPILEKAAEANRRQNTADYLQLCREVWRALPDGRAPWSQWAKLSKAAPEVALAPAMCHVSAIAGRHAEHPRLHEDLHGYLCRLFSLCSRALVEYADRKRELGLVDFVDQEHLLLRTLDHPEVRAALAEELDLLLVDEFQDTSPIQLALFLKLADLAREVFWVGDVKQAIYGFRGSDTALMEAVLRELPRIGGTKEVLGSSHRSRPSLVRLVNTVFGSAFAPALPEHEVHLRAERTEPDIGPAFGNWLLQGVNIQEQMAALGAGIRRLLASGCRVVDKRSGEPRPARYGDIAVLARLNDRVTEAVVGLSAQGVPTETAQPGLLGRPEAVLAVACLRRLYDSRDTVATAEILSLADCQAPEVWLQDRLDFLAGGGGAGEWREVGESAHPLIARLAELRAQLPVLTPREALELVITHGDLPRLVLRWDADEEVGRARLANLEALLALAVQYEDSCRSTRSAATISGLILWLREQARQELDMLAEPDLDAVKVLTHHGAKGLEWPIVILLDVSSDMRDRLWSISAVSRRPIELAASLQDRFIRFWPWPYGLQRKLQIADDIAQTSVAAHFQAATVDEGKRLLYVSMTRARDLLVLARPAKRLNGPWIETLEAPWLLPEKGCSPPTTPSPSAPPLLGKEGREEPTPLLPEEGCPRSGRGGGSPPEEGWHAQRDGVVGAGLPAQPMERNLEERTNSAQPGTNALLLPDGSTIPYLHWELDASVAQPLAPREEQPLYWFGQAHGPSARLPLIVTPSSAQSVPIQPGEMVRIGNRITLGTGVDVQRVGSAIHSCIAAAMCSGEQSLSAEEVSQVLAAWQCADALDATHVLAQLAALQGWIADRWPSASARAEVPIEACLPNGQVVKGQIDLLLDSPAGWILIDHKANPRGSDSWEEVARRYGGQLKLYKDAIELATSRPVAEVWLYFPVAAGAISVGV